MNPLLIAKLIGYAVAVAAVVGFVMLVLSWYDDSKQLDLCNATLETQNETIKQNAEATSDYQSRLARLNAELAGRVQPSECIRVQPARLPDNAARENGNPEQERGFHSQFLRQIAGDMKRTALYAEACSQWVKKQKGLNHD